MMYGHEKSDSAIVATKPPNKAGRPAAEAVERRAEAKENANRCRTCRTQCRESVSQVPERVRKAARPAVKHPRWEPYAGKPHVRFYAVPYSGLKTSVSVTSARYLRRRPQLRPQMALDTHIPGEHGGVLCAERLAWFDSTLV